MRKYLLFSVSLLGIMVLAIILIRPWQGANTSDLWPHINLHEATRIAVTRGESYTLEKKDDVWFAFQGEKKHLADRRRLEDLISYLNALRPEPAMAQSSGQSSAQTSGRGGENAEGNGAGGNGSELAINLRAKLGAYDALERSESQAGGELAAESGAGNSLEGAGKKKLKNNYTNPSKPAVNPEAGEKPEQAKEGDEEDLSDSSSIPVSLEIEAGDTWKLEPLARVKNSDLISVKVTKNNDTSHLVYVPSAFIKRISRQYRYFCDFRLFGARPERVVRLEISAPSGELWELEKYTEGTFTFIKPARMANIEVPQAGMEFYLHALFSSQNPAELFEASPPLLGKVFLTVKVELEKGGIASKGDLQEETLTLYYDKAGRDFIGYSSYQSAYFKIDAQKTDQLVRATLALHNRPVLPNGLGRVEEAELTVWSGKGEPQTRHFSRLSNGWADIDKTVSEFDSSIMLIGVDTIFWRLATLQATGKAETKTPPKLLPLMKWALFYTDKKETFEIIFYSSPATPKTHWVQVGKGGPFYPVQAAAITELFGFLPAPAK